VGRALRRRRREDKTLVPDWPEAAQGLVAADKGDLLRHGLGRLADRLRESMRFLYALSVRHIYANLCRLAASRGSPRLPQQTPNEYQERLVEAWPEHAAEIRTITQAYVRAHYGAVPDSREELDRIRHAWRRIQSSV
jgi:hypothetical protein